MTTSMKLMHLFDSELRVRFPPSANQHGPGPGARVRPGRIAGGPTPLANQLGLNRRTFSATQYALPGSTVGDCPSRCDREPVTRPLLGRDLTSSDSIGWQQAAGGAATRDSKAQPDGRAAGSPEGPWAAAQAGACP